MASKTIEKRLADHEKQREALVSEKTALVEAGLAAGAGEEGTEWWQSAQLKAYLEDHEKLGAEEHASEGVACHGRV